jgi:2-oxo-4-hydroxy-4-carboxy-5-ureidoimidazoline decarboxylase
MSNTKYDIEQINQMDESTFASALGAIYENSPWVARDAWPGRPFPSVEILHTAMDAAMRQAGRAQQMELVKAHPELAGRLARAGQLTGASRAEQAQAGLTELSESLLERIIRLNAGYRAKFGFPFIICTRLNSVSTILQSIEQRLENGPEVEFENALGEISKISKLRLMDLIK